MKIAVQILIATIYFSVANGQSKIQLPNGWSLSPAGKTIALESDLPLNMALSADGKYVAIVSNGVSKQTIELLSAKNYALLHSVEIQKSWLGIKFSSDSKYLYASGGNDNQILKYSIVNGRLCLSNSIILGKKWPVKISPAGLDIDDKTSTLYVVTKENNSLYVIDRRNNAVKQTVQLSAQCYTCLLSRAADRLYISLWGGGKVMVYDTKQHTITDSIAVGRNPNDMCITRNGRYLFVANSIDNSVSVIETATGSVIETLNAALYPNALAGSTTNSVVLADNDHTLYIANADNNCLAVFDVSNPGNSSSKGFIPVGWYPTCVRVSGKNILVLNGKGNSSAPNPNGPNPAHKAEEDNYKKANKANDQYIGSLLKGTMSVIPVPAHKQLAIYSGRVYENTPYIKEQELTAKGEPGNPIPMKVGDGSPIKYVFYVMKENRTYDQVLADEPWGNGDTTLLLFGRRITPNQHALAEQFVLLDNFYVDAEVSADGHNWSMAAYANDYIEKTWPTNYGGRGGTYDYAANKSIALPRNGFLWDYALRAGVTFRDYGEFTDDDGGVYLPELKKHMCKAYPGWNLSVKDVDREKIWEKDFDSLLAINAVPRLNIIYFPSDHTAGLSRENRTPFAFVADNDLALGLFVEHLSHCSIWSESAVFVLEDDAQNGPDHVDAHRSIAFVAGPYVKRGFVDHTMYSTTGMLRTMELILGINPMSQYDAAAMPMFRCFTNKPDARPYGHIDEIVNMDEMNVAFNDLSNRSDQLDLARADRIPDRVMNDILWKGVKGNSAPCPAPIRAAFVAQSAAGEDKED